MRWDKLASIRAVLLVLLGFVLLTIAAWLTDVRLGLAVGGVCALALAYLTDAGGKP